MLGRLVVGETRGMVDVVALVQALSEGAEGPIADRCHSSQRSYEKELQKTRSAWGIQQEKAARRRRQNITNNRFPADRVNEVIDDLGHGAC